MPKAESSGSDGQDGRRWIRDTLSNLLDREGDGDVIVGHVGEGASGVAIGKNIIQVGTLVLPTLPVVGFLLFFALTLSFAGWVLVVPEQMPVGSFNVAVAEFGQEDAEGRLSPSEDGQELSKWVFGELQSEYKDFPEGLGRAVIWHSSMWPTEIRARIGLVANDDEADRLAERIGAHLVVYGTMSPDGDRATLKPQFYVSEVRSEADEIVGPHQLGSPIQLQLPIDPRDQKTGEYLRAKLGVRADALAWFTRGLVLDLSGQHRDSLDVFRQAEEELQSWQDEDGKEILYYFIGREALFLSHDDEDWLPTAEEAFKRALDINSDYARAHIGLGGVYYETAQHLPPELRLESTDLDDAIAQYALAVEQGPGSPGSQIALKGRLSLGTAYRLEAEAYLHRAAYPQAIEAYDEAIVHIDDAVSALDEEQHRLLAQGYKALGTALQGKAHAKYAQGDPAGSRPLYERASAAYAACIQHADADLYDAFLQQVKESGCEPYRDDVQDVLDDL